MNPYRQQTPHVKFISYTGKAPKLCDGNLTLEINKKIYCWSSNNSPLYNLEFFNYGDNPIKKQPWAILYAKIPAEIKQYIPEIEEVVNANVPMGCCGGCQMNVKDLMELIK